MLLFPLYSYGLEMRSNSTKSAQLFGAGVEMKTYSYLSPESGCLTTRSGCCRTHREKSLDIEKLLGEAQGRTFPSGWMDVRVLTEDTVN